MSIRDAALATGLSPKALRRRIERGTLASVMVGGRRQIPVEDLTRRGLVLVDGSTGAAIVDRRGLAAVAGDAVANRLLALESRVSALEAALDGAGPAVPQDQGAISTAAAVERRPVA